MQSFEKQIIAYVGTLTRFVVQNGLPANWFISPSHVAYRSSGGDDFESAVKYARSYASMGKITALGMGTNASAAAHLTEPITIGSFGHVDWMHIINASPEKHDNTFVGIEHAGFYNPDIDGVRTVLVEKKLSYTELNETGDQKAVAIPINPDGQAIYLSDSPLRDIVTRELEVEKAYLL